MRKADINDIGLDKIKAQETLVDDLTKTYNISKSRVIELLSNLSNRLDNATRSRIAINTDSIAAINYLQGYDAVYFTNLDEGTDLLDSAPPTSNVLALYVDSKVKRVTIDNNKVNWDKIIKPEATRYISNQIAKKSNLKYFIRKGAYQLDPIASFV